MEMIKDGRKNNDAKNNLCRKHHKQGYDSCGCGLPPLWQLANGWL